MLEEPLQFSLIQALQLTLKNDYPTKEEAGMVNAINFPEGVIIKTICIEPISCQECIGPFVSLCNASGHRKNRDGSISGAAGLACLLLPIGEKTRLRDPTQDVLIGFMQIVTY
jgi:hypothetical protein